MSKDIITEIDGFDDLPWFGIGVGGTVVGAFVSVGRTSVVVVGGAGVVGTTVVGTVVVSSEVRELR